MTTNYEKKAVKLIRIKESADVLYRTAVDLARSVDDMLDSGRIERDSEVHDLATWYVEVACDLVVMLDSLASEEELQEVYRRDRAEANGVRRNRSAGYHKISRLVPEDERIPEDALF